MGKQLKSKAEQEAILDQEIDTAAEKQDSPALQTLFSQEFLHMNDVQAIEVATAVSKNVRGDITKEVSDQIGKLKAYLDEREEERRKCDEDKMKWFQEQLDKANSKRKTGSERAKVQAKAAAINQKAREEAAAESATAVLEFEQRMANAPKKTIIGRGKEYNTGNGKVLVPEIYIRSVGSKRYKFSFPPDEPVTYPDFIVDEYIARKVLGKRFGKLEQKLKEFPDFREVEQLEPAVTPSNFEAAIEQSQKIISSVHKEN